MPRVGLYRKSPVMLGEKLHKSKHDAKPYNHMGAQYGGYINNKPNTNGRNVAFDAVKKSLGRLGKKGLEAVEKTAEKALSKVADKALEKVMGKE